MNRRISHWLAASLACAGLLFLALATPSYVLPQGMEGSFNERRYPVEIVRDVQYGVGETVRGAMPLLADLYLPSAGPAVRPAFVAIHGGGFVQGSRSQPPWPELCRQLASRGYVCLSIDYRLQGDAPVAPGRTPRTRAVAAAVADGTKAVEWLNREADRLGIDRGRIAIGGGSAGASTSLLVAYGDDAPPLGAVVDLWGSLGGQVDLIDPGAPPVLIVHGVDDPLVPIADGRSIADRAQVVGVPYQFHPVQEAGHGMPLGRSIDGRTLAVVIADFLHQALQLDELDG